MFDRLPARPSTSGLKRVFGRGRRSTAFVIVIALAASAGLSGTWPSAAVAADPDGGAQSPQYQEFLSDAGKSYQFTPGGPVTVPFKPRPGDTDTVDGGSPVALPAAAGSKGTSPNMMGPAGVAPTNTTTILRREVFGFLTDGFMARTGGVTLDYNTLSTIAYFGVGLNVDLTGTDPTNDGALYQSGSGWNGWRSSLMTSIINSAHASGTRVVLTIESFAWDNSSGGIDMQTHLLSTPAARTRAAQQIAAEVYSRGADGVDLDFEPIVTSQRANYVTFVRQLRVELDKLHPGYELTFCANGAPGTYDLPNLLAAGAADAVFIMGYNLRGGSPAVSGSIDPLTSTSTTYSLTRRS